VTYDFAWLAILLPDRRWVYIGVLVHGDQPPALSFHPVKGFDIPAQPMIESADRATGNGLADEGWSYWTERGGVGLSQLSEPDTIDAPDRAAAVAKLMRSIPEVR
jgi:hypothetical protein